MHVCVRGVQVIFPQDPGLAGKNLNDVSRPHPTTISHTFAEYNTIVTIYIIGPLSLLFLFRVNRTWEDSSLTDRKKKLTFLVLIFVQYSTLVVVRVDTLKGTVHYLFTALTFAGIIMYHACVTSLYDLQESQQERRDKGKLCKLRISAMSICAMLVFAVTILCVDNVRNKVAVWSLICGLEIVAILLLGAMDMVDIFTLAVDLKSHYK